VEDVAKMLQYNFRITTNDGERFEVISTVILTKEDATEHIQNAMEDGRLPIATAARMNNLIVKAADWPKRVSPITPYIITIQEGYRILGRIKFTARVEDIKKC
jgi:hypothetical protein